MKNRAQEMSVIENFNQLFSEKVIPLIEIIADNYEVKYKIDPETNKPILQKVPNKKRRQRIKLPKSEEDIITLPTLHRKLNGKKAFIDFFRYRNQEYPDGSIKLDNVMLSFNLSRNYSLYRNRTLEIKNYENFIPTISIKEGFEISRTDLESLVSDFKANNTPIAIRITDNLFDDYSKIISQFLHHQDYLMLDIREQNSESKFIELMEFQDFKTDATKILLNSPRLRETNNGEYEHLQFTEKIDNSCAVIYKKYNLDGFGDFGGLRDTLPTGGGHYGCALSLIYSKNHNKFFSAVNKDSESGVRGYRIIIPELLNYENIYNPNKDCPIINEIKSNAKDGKFGNFQKWTYYTLARYIHQQATK